MVVFRGGFGAVLKSPHPEPANLLVRWHISGWVLPRIVYISLIYRHPPSRRTRGCRGVAAARTSARSFLRSPSSSPLSAFVHVCLAPPWSAVSRCANGRAACDPAGESCSRRASAAPGRFRRDSRIPAAWADIACAGEPCRGPSRNELENFSDRRCPETAFSAEVVSRPFASRCQERPRDRDPPPRPGRLLEPQRTRHTTERPATVTPLRRPRRRHGEITVERIETTPMTPEQYRRAVAALAVLVNEWKYGPDNPEQSSEKAA